MKYRCDVYRESHAAPVCSATPKRLRILAQLCVEDGGAFGEGNDPSAGAA